ncbi:oxygen-insensitive NADPH nitroreductase [Paenibacillus sambharensis]|uniref:Oxygen-insensitive NADPH nitroreductase n=1 Tax=Paenibacillus sambharensis TaxID=1803190 RepID=A0A2W1LBG4_9BACL|nr:oxygen-insensitive NADPH nitroreductase [Paenibacillus sambharensis]PZD96253.1 oxygen-insensitive NADPH nitroreductase [Paenibacillus sambharensis]
METNYGLTIEGLMKHRSIRKFTNQQIAGEHRAAILAAAQHASSSSNMQAFSVIRITDKGLRETLMAITGNQSYVLESPEFWVWCADLYRYTLAAGQGTADAGLDGANAEWYTIGAVDTALAAQNAAVAAESLGLGIVYIGGIRNDIRRVGELLKLPQLVVPLFGMCIGYPDQDPVVRPRLSPEAVMHENEYSSEAYHSHIAEYDERHRAYMRERSGGKLESSWSEQMTAKQSQSGRQIGGYLKNQGFRLDD